MDSSITFKNNVAFLITLFTTIFLCLGISESVEHILNELEDLFQSLVRRMNKSEMEDFELVNCFTYYMLRYQPDSNSTASSILFGDRPFAAGIM